MSEPKSFIGRRIGATEWNIVDMQETKRNKNTASGSVRVRSGNNSKLLTWSAVNTAPGKWSISGPGARLTNNTVVPNARDFPWMLNSEFNGALRGVLSEWLNHRNGQPQPASTATPVARPPSPPTPPPIPPPAPARKQTAPSPAPQPTRPPAPRLSLTSASPVAPPRVPITPLAVPAVRGEPAMELVHASVAEIIAFRGEQNNDTGAALIKSQPRAYFNPKKLKALGKSLSSPGEQQLPITVIRISDVPNKKYEIVDGERRWRSALEAGMTHIWCFVRKPLDKRRQHLSALVANFCKEGHTHLELSRALALQYDEGNGVSVQELSEMLNLSPCLIYQSIALQKLLPELQNLLDPPVPRKERLRFECARILAKAPPEKQMEYYREAKKEATPVLMKLRLRELCAEWLVKRGRKRQPSDYVPILRRIVSTTASDARLISDQSGTESVKLLSAGLKPEERAGFVRSLQAGISALQGLVNELAPKTEK